MGRVLDRSREVLRAIAAAGTGHPARPELAGVEPFKAYFRGGELDAAALDERDGGVTRREALVRFLVLSCVVDQGPDIVGVQRLVAETTTRLYRQEVRLFHRPLDFFQHLHISLDGIDSVHALVKKERAAKWAVENESSAGRYNLFVESSQTLGYAMFRWGAPLGLAYLAVKEAERAGREPATALCDHFKAHESAEQMSKQLKENRRFGLGKAIGDKAAHLLGKWTVHSYPLLRDDAALAWDPWSYEVPFDSNAGRVLYRTGLLDLWGTAREYGKREVLQPREGKDGKTYLRVTNLRGIHSRAAAGERNIRDANADLCTRHLVTHSQRPQKVEIQRLPSVVSLIDRTYTPGDIDDGLIRVGTTWCFNHDEPKCGECPLRVVCAAASGERDLITGVST